MSKAPPKRYAPRDAMKRIKSNLVNGGTILTGHFSKQILSRGIDMNDVMHVLKQGCIISQPEPHTRTGRWIYNVQGETFDGEQLKVSVDIVDKNNVLLTAIC